MNTLERYGSLARELFAMATLGAGALSLDARLPLRRTALHSTAGVRA